MNIKWIYHAILSPFLFFHLTSVTAPYMFTHSSTITFKEFILLSPVYHVLWLSVVLHATMIMCVLVRLLTPITSACYCDGLHIHAEE